MEIIKILLLILAYTLGIATLIVQIICYLKYLEYKETIVFTIAFLLLIIVITIQSIIKTESPVFNQFQELVTNLLTVLLTVSIPINIHKERIDKFRIKRNSVVIILGTVITLLTIMFHYIHYSFPTVIILSVYLFISVIYSMFFVLFTKPESLIQFREKTERIIAIIILIIMIISLVLFLFHIEDISLKFMYQYRGFVLAFIFIILSLYKIPDDIKKLTHHGTKVSIKESKLSLLGITKREQEVLLLLIQGKAYKKIAAELFISLPTVKTHVSNIYSKANVRNRLELSNLIKHDSVN